MSKIVLIATGDSIYEYGNKIKSQLDNPDDLDVEIGSMDSAIEIVKKLKSDEVDVIISRGTTADVISKLNIGIPIVEVTISDEEILRAMNIAKNITGKEEPVIAYIGLTRTYEDVRIFLEAMDIIVHKYEVNSESEIRETLEKIKENKDIDIIIGGNSTYVAAKEFGLKCILLESSQASVNNAYKNAKKLQLAMQSERKILAERNTIINAVRDIIISVDNNGRIVLFNNSAAEATGRKSEDVLGKNIYNDFGFFNTKYIESALINGESTIGKIVELKNKKYVVNTYPIIIKHSKLGAIITMQGVEELQNTEITVRKGLYLKGNVAKYNFTDILGKSQEIKETIEMAKKFAGMEHNVIIIGETGTGKELFAQSIHNASKRKEGPFVAVNCGAIPKELIESELFGYVEGSFSGAKRAGK